MENFYLQPIEQVDCHVDDLAPDPAAIFDGVHGQAGDGFHAQHGFVAGRGPRSELKDQPRRRRGHAQGPA